jgi:predicted DNA-binding antitoxin AbrB/MazE fold protein
MLAWCPVNFTEVYSGPPETLSRLVVGNRITEAAVMTIAAKYENGVFKPLEDVQIKEGTVVEVLVPAEQKPAGKRRSIKDLGNNLLDNSRPGRLGLSAWFLTN